MDGKSLIYQFDDVRVDLKAFRVFKAGTPVTVEPKSFEVLVFLIENRGRLIEKKELLDAVWKDAFVTENAMTRVIAQLRKALGDDKKQARYIETAPTRGYRFIPDVQVAHSVTAHVGSSDGEPSAADSHVTGRVLNDTKHTRRFGSRSALVLAACVGLVLVAAGLLYFWILDKPNPSRDGPTRRSIAVLPFKPLVAEGRDESLEMGMADTLITKLSSIEQLMIRPMSAVRKYSGPEQDPVAAGRELGADLVLECSLQKSGDRIRVTARLWNVADAKMLWSETRDQQLTDIFAVQDSIAEQVSTALTFRLSPEVKKRLIKHSTENTEAYYLFVNGSFQLRKGEAENVKKAISYFEKAVAVDPSYALAYASLSESYARLGQPGVSLLPPKDAMLNSKQAALTALKLDDSLAEAHVSLALTRLRYDWDWRGAEEEFKRALELDPRNPPAHNAYSTYLSMMGRHDEAIAEQKQALELDPLDIGLNIEMGLRLYVVRRDDEAIEQARRTLAIDPARALLDVAAAWAYEQKGMYEDAIAIYSDLIKRHGENPANLSFLGRAFAVAGRKEEALKVIQDLNERAKRGYVSPYLVANIYARLGDKDQTMIWLEKAYLSRDDWMVWIKVDPVFDVVRSDPRFADLVRRVGLAP